MDYLNKPLASFFAASLAIHLAFLMFLLLGPNPSKHLAPQETINVSILPPPKESILPAPKESKPAPVQPVTKAPRERPTRPSRTPAIIAQKNSPEVAKAAPPKTATAPKEPREFNERKPDPAPAPPREQIEEPPVIAERRLPTVKELLPSGSNWSSPRRSVQGEGPIRLDTKNPQYITYFNSIKRDIELVWQYPEPALRYGLQGKLLLEFAILASGELESARVIRSSGSNLLDLEALRAVKTAAPFKPIPPWIDKNRIAILATFEYLDNRLNYRVMP